MVGGMEWSATSTASGVIGTTVSGSKVLIAMLSLSLQWIAWYGAPIQQQQQPRFQQPQLLQPQSQQHGNVPVQHQNYHQARIIINDFPKHNLNLITRGPGDLIQLAR